MAAQVSATATPACPSPAPRIVAHRGASFDAPENTLAALRLGFAQGADAGECDVRLSADGHAVLMHDADTRRTTGVEREVAATSLAELRALGVATLEDALGCVPAGRGLLIEIKCGPEILPAVERALDEARPGREGVVLMSFDRAVTTEARRRFPALELHQLSEWREGLGADALVEEARALGVQGLNLDRRFPIDAAFVATVHAAGLRLCVWTVDEPELARRLAAAGADLITTNRPGWLRTFFA